VILSKIKLISSEIALYSQRIPVMLVPRFNPSSQLNLTQLVALSAPEGWRRESEGKSEKTHKSR